jgi:hypothetical protein
MSAAILEPQIFGELKAALNHGIASGELLTRLQSSSKQRSFVSALDQPCCVISTVKPCCV